MRQFIKNIIFIKLLKLIILSIYFSFLSLSCNFEKKQEKTIIKKKEEIPNDFNTQNKEVSSNSKIKVEVPTGIPFDFDIQPYAYFLDEGINIGTINFDHINNKLADIVITNTSKQDYFISIKISENEVGKIYYLNTRLITTDAGYGSYIGVYLTFNENNPDYSYRIFATTKHDAVVKEIFKGWYKIAKINDRGGYVPILLKV